MKISKRLTKRQTAEWLEASTTTRDKLLELTSLYGELSTQTHDFHSKCLTKHRNQAYVEWQRQTAKVKNALRVAKEEAALT